MRFSQEWKHELRSEQTPNGKRIPMQTFPTQALPVLANGLAGKVQNWFRTRTGSANARRLRLVETLPLGPRRSVALIECDGRCFLAGMGGDGVTTLVPLATQGSIAQMEAA